MHVLIIGGGIIGLLTALELSQSGCQVTILDAQDFGQAASWAGGGILSTMYPWRYNKPINQLAMRGKALYQEWQPILQQATGLDIEINPSGMLILDQADFEIGLNWASQDNDPQQTATLLDAAQLHTISPHLNQTIQQALWFPQLANIRNPRLLKTLIAFLTLQPNVKLVTHTAVRQFVVKNHTVTSVLDQNNKQWQANQYVVASGAWSGLLSQQFNWQLPIKPIQGQMLLFKAYQNLLPTMIMNNGLYLIPRLDGHIVCGSSSADIGFNTEVNPTIGKQLQQQAFDILPALENAIRLKGWAGLRPAAPDGIPFIGKAPNLDNLWLNAGHYRNGLVMAPASARLLRQQLLNEPRLVDDQPYNPAQRLI